MANRFWDAIKPYKTSVFIPTCIASLLANWLLLINGYGCPDNLCEGAMLYHGGDWALSLGRWVIRYINAATLNIVLPVVNVAASIFCCCIVTILLGKLFAFSYKPFLALTSIFLATGEAVTCQYLYIYMDLAFTWALLLSALSAYFVLTGTGRKSILFAALALAFALGGYQAYVGFTAAIIVITLILRLLRGESAQGCLKAAGRALLMGGVGCLLYLFFMSGMQVLYHTPMADYSGANEVGLSNTISNLGHSLRSVYGDFVKYLLKDTNYRNLFFLPLCCIVILLCFGRTIALVRKKGKKEAAFGLVLMIMLPLAMNLVTIITPERSTSSLMSHQMQLLLPFLFALLEISKTTIEEKVWKSLKFVTSILSTLLCWSCVLTAYATHASVAYMYQYMKAYAIPLLARVQEDGEYSSGDRILFAGLPDEEKIQSMNPLYKYSYRYRAVFWDGEYGVLTCWPRYIQYYLSMDTGFISADEYHEVLDSEKFAEMNCYPEIDSIAKIGDIMVVKLESAPPRN